MRICLLLCSVILIFSTGIAQSKLDDRKGDTPLVRTVRSLLRQPAGFSSSFSEKQAHRLGDKVSLGLLKIYNEEELSNPQNISIFLPAIRASFLYPDLIAAGDRRPRVTLPLLARIGKKVGDPALKREIDTLINFIKEQSSSPKKS